METVEEPGTAIGPGRRAARRGATELSEEQKPSELLAPAVATVTEVLEPEPAPVLVVHRRFPDLVPEWVPKLQVLASGAAILFAAVAIVVERHEQRYHQHPNDDERALD